MTTIKHTVELQRAAATGKPFVALYAPLKLPSHGVEFEHDDIRDIARTWERLDGPGKVPILRDHQPGAAMGWIEDVQAVRVGERTELRVSPSWTAEGRAAIAGGSYKFCSVGLLPEE